MITFDTRFLAAAIAASAALFALSKIRLSELKGVIALIAAFLVVNNIAIFLFSPQEGVKIYGSSHELFHIAGKYSVFKEQLFYQLNVTLKYFAIAPAALVFFATTDPSEFASSLNALKVHYKAAYAVSLSLRYIPEAMRSYKEISQAQQARGVDISPKAKLRKRLAGVLAILFPLVFSSLDKIDTVSDAMELRGFGRMKKRTWYSARRFSKADFAAVVFSAAAVALSALTIWANGGRFLNPWK
jgi:energy-coupling factor transport system permease protein